MVHSMCHSKDSYHYNINRTVIVQSSSIVRMYYGLIIPTMLNRYTKRLSGITIPCVSITTLGGSFDIKIALVA